MLQMFGGRKSMSQAPSTEREKGSSEMHSSPKEPRKSIDVTREELERNSLDVSSPAVSTTGSTRVERLLRERELRRTRSSGGLAEAQETVEHQQKRHVKASTHSERASSSSRASGGLQRLIVVANRLPISAKQRPDGTWNLEKSAGGLVSALLGIHSNYNTTWIGWPGVFVQEGKDRDSLTALLKQENCAPVYLDEDTVDLYYNGYCNNVLWPLFHYVPLPLEARLSETKTLQAQWAAYQAANNEFAAAVLQEYREGDVVWCHDYHVLLLPRILKQLKPQMKVGWFLHTPFPSSEIYRALPRREEILRGVLKADLIGFHTYDYARHFVSACTRILGLEGTPEGVEDAGCVTRVAAFPIGIDPERFTAALETDEVKANIAELKKRFGGRKVMLGVDRLDMIKGIPQKLLAYEMFLDENPEWQDKVLLVQIAVPSRTHVLEYKKLASLVHEMVGRINGRFGTLGSVPIHHLDRSLSFHELCALYALTDIALVTPVRDGMNLVSYEVVACQSKNAGVLILSEFAGAAQSLGAGAILVNPWNVSDLAAAIGEALTMSDAERRERHRQNFMHVTIHTAQAWADTFVSELNDTHVEAALRTMRTPPLLSKEQLVNSFLAAKQRFIILGFNATLTTIAPEAPRRASQIDQIKTLSQVHPWVMEALQELCKNPQTTIIIFSGSGRSRLEEHFGKLPVWMAAENGVFIRAPQREGKDPPRWQTTTDTMNMDWLESVQLVFDYFCERTPRSFVETRETSLVWNYKYADPEFGKIQARDLLQHLVTGPISSAPVDVIQGSKSVEVRHVGVSKGAVMDRVLRAAMMEPGRSAGTPIDFVLCVGHFLGRDEDIFHYFEEARGAMQPEDMHGPGPSYGGQEGSRMTTGTRVLSEGMTDVRTARAARSRLGEEEEEEEEEEENGAGAGASTSECELAQLDGLEDEHDGGHWSMGQRECTGSSSSSPWEAPPGPHRHMHSSSFTTSPAHKFLHPRHLYTCTVGRKKSQARFFVNDSSEVAQLLKHLREATKKQNKKQNGWYHYSFKDKRQSDRGAMDNAALFTM